LPLPMPIETEQKLEHPSRGIDGQKNVPPPAEGGEYGFEEVSLVAEDFRGWEFGSLVGEEGAVELSEESAGSAAGGDEYVAGGSVFEEGAGVEVFFGGVVVDGCDDYFGFVGEAAEYEE